MSKKIGTFLMMILVIWSVLLLDATKNRRAPQAETRPTESTGASTEPSAAEPVPSEAAPPAETPAESQACTRVEAILDRSSLDQTTVTHRVRESAEIPPNAWTAALAELAAEREMNPVSAFWLLVSEGLYERNGEQAGLPAVSLPEVPEQTAKQYPYTDAGAEQLLTDLLTLAGRMEDGLALEQALLGADGAVDPGQVSLAGQEECRYAYFACAADGATQILCFYLRSDSRGEWIRDVEFQLLHMAHGSGTEQGDGQAVSLAAAAELLMTGTARAGAGETASYEAGGCTAAAERFFFTAEAEQGSLTNYRLRQEP